VHVSSIFITFLFYIHIGEKGWNDMSIVEKMDVLDFIIKTLKEHERTLDDLAYRLEACLSGSPVGKTPDSEKGAQLENWR
jgi:hypothetical protein